MLKGATHKFKENPLGKTIKYSFDLSSEKVQSSTPKPSIKDNIQSSELDSLGEYHKTNINGRIFSAV